MSGMKRYPVNISDFQLLVSMFFFPYQMIGS